MHYLYKHLMMMAVTALPLAAQSFTFTKIADTSTPVPSGAGNFVTFSNMVSVDESGNVAFSENNGTTNNGIYLARSGALSRVADLKTAIPGGTGNFTAFAFFGNGIEGGRLAFRGNGSDGQAGVYAYSSGSLTKVANTNSLIPGGTGKFTSFGTAYVDGTNYAFVGPGDSGQQGLYVSNGSTITRIADKTSTVPGIGGSYGWSSQVGFDQGNLAFWAYIAGGTNPGSIVGGYNAGGGLVTLASTATAVPGAGTTFTNFTSPVDLSGSTVVFGGQYGTGGHGIYTTNLSGAPITTIADLSTPVPNGTGIFTQVQNPNIAGGRVVFQGTFVTGSGIYVQEDATLKKVIDTTDLIDGKAISSFGLSENSLSANHLAFRVNFTDSSVGIYRTSFVPNVTVRKPDALIESKISTIFLGDNVYNTTGSSQTRTTSVSPSKSYTFNMTIQNDGTAADKFKIKATGLPSNQYVATYFHGRTNITAKVVAGTYETTSLAPGDFYQIKAKVQLKSTAVGGSRFARLVTVSSASSAKKKDAVKFVVKCSK